MHCYVPFSAKDDYDARRPSFSDLVIRSKRPPGRMLSGHAAVARAATPLARTAAGLLRSKGQGGVDGVHRRTPTAAGMTQVGASRVAQDVEANELSFVRRDWNQVCSGASSIYNQQRAN